MLARLRIELEDRLRYDPGVRRVLAAWKARQAGSPAQSDPQGIARAISRLCEAARLAPEQTQLLHLEDRIARLVALLGGRPVDWREFEPSAEKRILENALVLKPCVSEREKGVVYLTFEYQWPRLLQNCDVREFARRYQLVLGPVWATPHGLVNYLLPAQWPGPVFSHLSDPKDADTLPRMAANHVIVPVYCSSWVNPEWYPTVPFEQKNLDVFMLANFGKYKRHFALFQALRDMPRETRVLLIGQRNGARTREVLLREARAYGVADRFELKENATDAEVFQAFARAKTSVILSRREGSCIAIVESLFANTPAALLADAEVGSRVFINEQTGRLLQHDRLGAQLTQFIAEARRYSPRAYMLEHQVHCHGSSATLNRIVRQTCLDQGQDWTMDLAPFQWRPEPRPIHEAARLRLQAARADIQARFGLQIGKEPIAAP